jgi:hypothetical protein
VTTTAPATATITATRAGRAVWLCLPAGAALLIAAYTLAGRSTENGGQAKFVLFWLGILVFLVPVVRRLATPDATGSERVTLLAGTGLFLSLPKLLRNPRQPVFYDELAHWSQVERLHETGELFRPNPAVRVLPSYPGLHTVTDGVRQLTGLSTWQSALLLLAVLHVVGLVGAFVLVRRVTGSAVVAGLAGLVWALAPGALFFNAQFAYQSLAIVVFVWVLAAVAEAQAAIGPVRWAWAGLAALLGLQVVVTHHLTSYALVLVLAVLAVVAAVRPERRSELAPTAAVLGVVTVANIAWMALRGGRAAVESIVDYLSPYPSDGLDQLWGALSGSGQRREFFVRSGLPGWEQSMAYIAPVLVVVLAVAGVRLLWRMEPRPVSATWGLVAVGGLYLAALPLVLTPTGAQGAHRSFPFTYLGAAVAVGAGLVALLRATGTRSSGVQRAGRLALLAVLAVLAMGNVASNVNEFDRFPGPWEAGSDARNLTAELQASSEWLAEYESDDRVVADLYSGTAFGMLGTEREACAVAAACPGGLPLWRFYDGQEIRPQELEALRADGYRFLVVDRRMAETTPRSGYWFNRAEEGAFEHEPYSRETLTRLETMTWLTKVSTSTSFDVYLINIDAAEADVLEGEPGAATIAAEDPADRADVEPTDDALPVADPAATDASGPTTPTEPAP